MAALNASKGRIATDNPVSALLSEPVAHRGHSHVLYPLTFHPILKERVWGGRNLERLYQRPLPADRPIGESWEITDRPEGVSVIAHGPLAGRTLRWLMEEHGRELLGPGFTSTRSFPLLV